MAAKCQHLECRAAKIRSHCFYDDDPIVTTPEEARLIRDRASMTQEEAAIVVGKSGGRVWRRWEGSERTIDETSIRLFALLTGQPYPVRA